MKKLPHLFKEIRVEIEDGVKYHLILISHDEAHADWVYNDLSSSNEILIEYKNTPGYFDLIITLVEINAFIECNYHQDTVTTLLSKAIDFSQLVSLSIHYVLNDTDAPYASPILLTSLE